MSPWLPKAVLATEDRRFYSHPGVDVLGLARATFVNLRARRIVLVGTGGSGSILELLSFHLARLGLPIVRPRSDLEAITTLAGVDEQDVVLGATVWPFLRSTNEALRTAKRGGVVLLLEGG